MQAYLNLVSVAIRTEQTLFSGLILDPEPELSRGTVGSFLEVVGSFLVLQEYQGEAPGRALGMNLSITCIMYPNFLSVIGRGLEQNLFHDAYHITLWITSLKGTELALDLRHLSNNYLISEPLFDEIATPLAPPVIDVVSEVVSVDAFAYNLVGVVAFMDGALTNAAGYYVVLLVVLSEAGLAVGGGLV